MRIRLRGLTWEDPRGVGPLSVVQDSFARTPQGRDTSIEWTIQPLSGFESDPIEVAARRYDILNLDHPHIGQAVAHDALRPIPRVTDVFVGPSLDSYRWQGRLWAVPIDAGCQVAAHDVVALPQAPVRYEEVAALGRTVRAAASLVGIHALMALLTILNQAGHPLSPDPGAGWPAPEPFATAAEQLREVAARCRPESLDLDPQRLLAAMRQGWCDYVPFTFAYHSYADPGGRVRFAPVPAFEPHARAGSVLGGTGLAVSRSSRHPQAAVALVLHAASATVQVALWRQHGGQPAHAKAWLEAMQGDPFYAELWNPMHNAWCRPRYNGWNRRQSLAGRAVNAWLRQRRPSAQRLRERLTAIWRET